MLIAVVGKMRSGKDTFADYLMEHTPGKYTKRALADPLKNACKEIFLFSDAQLHGDEKESYDERWGTTARRVLQVVGSELFRDEFPKHIDGIGSNLWVKHFELWYEQLENKNVVLPGLRFQNEIEMVKKLGGIVIQVVSNKRLPPKDTHKSENSVLTGIDLVLENDGTLEEYHTLIEETIEKYNL